MARLLVRYEGKIIQEVNLESGQEYMAGRDESCQIMLKGKSGISRQHFKIHFNGNQWQVDVVSKFGHLNYQAQEVDTIVLANGNSFSLSPFDFQFVDETATRHKEAAPIVSEEVEEKPSHTSTNLPMVVPVRDGDTVKIDSHYPVAQKAQTGDDFQGDVDDTSPGLTLGEPMITLFSASNHELGVFELREGNLWLAGREDSCDIKIPDKKASRKHFEISRTHKGFAVTDLGSANGTYVNGRKIGSKASQNLNSGDAIKAASITIKFEIKNSAIQKQIENLPDILFQHTAIGRGGAPQFEKDDLPAVPPKLLQRFKENPKLLVIVALVLVILYSATNGSKKSDQSHQSSTIKVEDNPINNLTKEQRQYIKETYAAAQSLHSQGKYQLAASELKKIHEIVPYYESSKQLESECRDALAILQEQHDRDVADQKEKEIQQKVSQIVSACRTRFNTNTTVPEITACLQPASEMDPENKEIGELTRMAEAQDEQKRLQQMRKQEYDEKVRMGNNMYAKAEQYRRNQELFEALKAYEAYLNSTYPDPAGNKQSAKRSMASIQSTMNQKVDDLLKQAQDLSGRDDFKGAQMAINAAKKMNPQESRINEIEGQVSRVQNKKLLSLFQDAKLEESLGNIQVTREKCIKIMDLSFPENEHHKRCKSILKKYGD